MRGLPGAESGRPAPCSPLVSAAAPWQHHPASEPQLPPHPHAASRLLAAQSQAGSAAASPTGNTTAVLYSAMMLQETQPCGPQLPPHPHAARRSVSSRLSCCLSYSEHNSSPVFTHDAATDTCAFKPACLMSHNWLHTSKCKVRVTALWPSAAHALSCCCKAAVNPACLTAASPKKVQHMQQQVQLNYAVLSVAANQRSAQSRARLICCLPRENRYWPSAAKVW